MVRTGEVIDLRCGLVPNRRAEVLEWFRLDRKVALVAALASDVELLLFDEPNLGLDPLMEAEFRELVREERDRGRTVLLSSHILSEVEALCDRVALPRSRSCSSATTAMRCHRDRPALRPDRITALVLPEVNDRPDEVDGDHQRSRDLRPLTSFRSCPLLLAITSPFPG
ncbi:hypothetical protein GCM10029964_053840 [Kibdelosporangium lantanae]